MLLRCTILLLTLLSSADSLAQDLTPGKLMPKVIASSDSAQTFVLYLPSNYTAQRRWPVIFVFDPAARGGLAAEKFVTAAEKFGYILLVSNNSRNGPGRIQVEAWNAMTSEAHARLAFDPKRVYLAGFSGGARAAIAIAQGCRCAAGVIASGAGLPNEMKASDGLSFAIFEAAGTADYNYPELVRLHESLEKAGVTHRIVEFNGSHEWASSEAIADALAWFDTRAMITGPAARDEDFLQGESARRLGLATSLQQQGNVLSYERELASLAADFPDFPKAGDLRSRLEVVRKWEAFKKAQKQQAHSFRRQSEMYARVGAPMQTYISDPSSRVQSMQSVLSALSPLIRERQRASDPEEVLLYRRALGAIVAEASQQSGAAQAKKDYVLAAGLTEIIAAAAPKSAVAPVEAARNWALAGNKDAAIRSLREAQERGYKDFSRLADDPGFASLREHSEFRKLTQMAAAQ